MRARPAIIDVEEVDKGAEEKPDEDLEPDRKKERKEFTVKKLSNTFFCYFTRIILGHLSRAKNSER